MADKTSRSRSPKRSSPPESRRERSKSPRPRAEPEDGELPTSSTRTRSRSPPRGPKKSEFSKAFKWKSKGSNRDGEDRDYRSRDGQRDEYRPKRYGGRDDRDRKVERERERERDPGKVAEKFGGPDRGKRDGAAVDGEKERKKIPAPRPVAQPQTFIIVTVNDRLGTKASIPCLPSDTVGDFKKLVAAHIGRQTHEIMLKRQGERPFKDFITLGDYGVSNGVQLDLELDTGD